MEYKIKRVGQDEELEHALFGLGKKKSSSSSSSSSSGSGQQGAKKGSTWSNHLYIARQKAGDKWRYFYSQAELNAAKAKGAAKQAAKNVGDTARKGLATVKRTTADVGAKVKKIGKDVGSEIDYQAWIAGNRIKDTAKGAVNKAKDIADDARWAVYDAKEGIKDAAGKVKDAIDNPAKAKEHARSVLSGDYKKRVDENLDRTKEDLVRRQARDKRLKELHEEDFRKELNTHYDYSDPSKNSEEAEKIHNDYNNHWIADHKNYSKMLDDEYAVYRYERDKDSLAYKISDLAGKGKDLVNSGKSAVSKLIGNTKDAAGKAITTASDKAKSLANKGKAAVDKLGKVLSGEYHKEVNLEGDRIREARNNEKHIAKRIMGDNTGDEWVPVSSNNPRAQSHIDEMWDLNSKAIKNTDDKGSLAYKTSKAVAGAKDKVEDAKDALAKWRRDVSSSHVTSTSDLPPLSKSEKKYYKDAIKDLTDDEIEQNYISAKRKNSTSPQEKDKFELLTAERNYRVASREADRLGRLTDTKSDAAEAALKKYGQGSPQYKKAFDEMEEAFDQLHEAELELARYEKNR